MNILSDTKAHALKCVTRAFGYDFQDIKQITSSGNGIDANQRESLMRGIVSIIELGNTDFLESLSPSDLALLKSWNIIA